MNTFFKTFFFFLIVFSSISSKAQHSVSYHLLNTFEYRYTFKNQQSVFFGTRLIGAELNLMLVESQRDFDYSDFRLSVPLLDFWLGYGQRFGKHQLDYLFSFTAAQANDIFSLTDYQEQEPHSPIYVYTADASSLFGLGCRYTYFINQHYFIGSSLRLRLHTSSLKNGYTSSQREYGEIRTVEKGRLSLGINPIILGFQF